MEETRAIKGLKTRIRNVILKISALFLPLFQFIPTVSIWRGIMSTPLIGYIKCDSQRILIGEADVGTVMFTCVVLISYF